MSQQKLVDAWNAAHAIGTPVTRYKLMHPLAEPVETRTRSEAWLMGGHTAMVMVDGIAGGVLLTSVVVRDDSDIERDADREMFGDEPERFGLENVGNK